MNFVILLILKKKVMANNNGNNAIALLLGAAIGVGVGILFAPDKGSKTRAKLKNNFDDWKIDVNNKLADYEEDIRAKLSGSKEDLKETAASKAAEKKVKDKVTGEYKGKKLPKWGLIRKAKKND